MPLCIDIQVLLIAVFSIQQCALLTYAQSNLALYQELTVSPNNTCGLQGKDEFCAAIDQRRNCRQFDFCSTRCFFAETRPRNLDLVATGMFHGEAMLMNHLNSACHSPGKRTVQLNGTSGFISKSFDGSALFNDSQGLTLSLHLSQKLQDQSHIITIQDNSSLVSRVSTNSINHQLSMEFINSTGFISSVFVNVNLSDGICHHVAVVLFNSTVQLFADGKLVAEEITFRNLWKRSSNILVGGVPSGSADDYFIGQLGSAHLYTGPLLPSEIRALATGKGVRQPRLTPHCRCHVNYPYISADVDGIYCVSHKTNNSVRRVNEKAHFGGFANDGDIDTWWQSRRTQAPVNLTVSLGGIKQVLHVKIFFKWWPPEAFILLKSVDNGSTWTPFQYYAKDCRTFFNLENHGELDFPDSVNCVEGFSIPVPGEIVSFFLLETSRPGADSFPTNKTLQQFSLATHVRLSMVSFLGNLSEKTDYFAVSELEVYGRNCTCPAPENVYSCECNGSITRPPKCSEVLKFDRDRYTKNIFDQTPPGVPVAQVHAASLCTRSAPVYYFVIERNDTGAFHIDNATGVLKLRSYVLLNSTFRFLIEARLRNGLSTENASTLVFVNVVRRSPLTSRTTVDFETNRLGFIQGKQTSNVMRQFGFFVNGHPDVEGSLRASVGHVSAEENYTTARERATSVKAVLVSKDVYCDRPAVRVIAQVQDPSFHVRTLVDESEVVVKIIPSANLANIDGSLLQAIVKPNVANGIAAIEVPLPIQWFSDPSLVNPEMVSVTYRLRNSGLPPVLLGNAIIHPGPNTQLFSNDVYGVLPFEPVFAGGTFSFSVYCDSVYAVASFGIKLVIGPSLVIIGSQVDGQRWLHVAVNHSSTGWMVSGTLANPEVAPQGVVKKAQLVSFDVKVKDKADLDTNATLAVKVLYLSNINNEEVQIGGQPLPVMAAMVDGSDQSRHTLGIIRITANVVTELIPYAEPSELVNTAVINGQVVSTNMMLLAVQRSGDITVLSNANCTSLSQAIQVTKNCSKVFQNGSEAEGSPNARVRVQFHNLTAFVSFRVWFPVLPLNLTLKHPDLARVSGWLEFNASSGKCVQRYQWSEVQSEVLFSFNGDHFENISTPFVRDLLTSANKSVAIVDKFGNVNGMSSGRTIIRAVSPLNGAILGSAEVSVSSLRSVEVKFIDVVIITNLTVSIPAPPYHRLSTQMAVTSVHQDLRRDLTRGAVVAHVTFSDDRRQKLTSELGLTLKSLNDQVLRVSSQSEAISFGSGAGVLQADWWLPSSICYPYGFSLGVGYEITNVSLLPPTELEITGVSPQITVPGDASTVAGIPTSSPVVVTLVFENGNRVDMSLDSRTVFDLSQSDGFFTVDRVENMPVINANKQGKFGKKDLVVRFTHFAISGSVKINIVRYVNFALHAKPYPPFPGSSLINSLSRIADTSSHEMASLELFMVMSDGINFDVTRHQFTTFSSLSADLIVGQSDANRVTVRPGVTSRVTAVLEGRFSNVGKMDLVMFVENSAVNVTSIRNLAISPENNQTLSGVENSIVAQVQLSLTFSNARRVEQFYDRSTALFPGLITLTSENNQVFTVDSTTGQVTLRRNYHQTLSLTAAASLSMVTSSISVTCNLQPGIGDVDVGEERGLPLPPRALGSTFQMKFRFNAGGSPGMKKMDLTLSYDHIKLLVISVTVRRIWSCVSNLNTPGHVSLDCDSDSSLTGIVEIGSITFNATNSGLAAVLGSVTTDLGSSSLVAGDVDQEIVVSGKRRRRSLDDNDRRDVLVAHTRRRRSALFCASPPCQCVNPLSPGDVNRDCLFDLSDVLFVLRYFTYSSFNFSSVPGNQFVQSLSPNQSRDLDVDRNTMVNPADAYYLVRVLLDLVRFVSDISVVPVQLLSSDCKLSFSVTLSGKNGPAPDRNTFVFFDVIYKLSPVDFAGTTGLQRGVGFYGNLIRAVSQGNGRFTIQAPFELVQESIGLIVFHVTLDSNNRTSVVRSSALLGNPRPPFMFPFRLSLDLDVANESISLTTNNNYNPFVVFNNMLSSAACKNNFTPQFEQLVYHASVLENATVNSSVLTVNATDKDSGNSGRIWYSLIAHETLPFAVNSTSGVLRIVRSLDREQKARYNLTARATDGGAPGRERFTHAHIIITIGDVNDNAPVVRDIIPSPVIRIPENAVIGNPLARLIASDADVGENAVFYFSLYGSSSLNGPFLVNSTTGELLLNSSLRGKVGSVYKIVVLVSDYGIPALTSNSTVGIRVTYATDVEIFFTFEFYEANVTENSVENTSVVQVKAYVPGLPSAFIVYSLLQKISPFKIDSSNGHVMVNTTVDREGDSFFSLTVTARYGINVSTNATISITILDQNDNEPVPYPVPLLLVPYNHPVGSEIYRLNVSDRDIGENAALKFTLLGSGSNLFVIDKGSGVIFLNSPLFNLNETYQQLFIEVADSGLPRLSSNVTVNISFFFPPRFSNQFSSITTPEDISTGTVLYTFAPRNISSQDMDTYFIISNDNTDDKFSIRNVSGEVSVRKSLDREQRIFYSLSIMAWNFAVEKFAEIQPTQLLLNITLLDVNDNAPYLEAIQPITIKNTAHMGYTLVQVTATDLDEGLNAQLQYNITSGNELNIFVIDELGFLRLNASLLYGNIPFFSLTINVSDHGSPVLYNTTQVNITVEDDRSSPRFNRTFYNVSLWENSPPGTEVIAVFATDPNGDSLFYNVSFNFASLSSIFELNFTSNRIKTLAKLDRESEEVYHFEVIVYKISPLTSEKYFDNATVYVHILDINDESPRFEQRVYEVELKEENSPSAELLSVHANDNDKGLNALLSYAIISGNESIFSINSISGAITVLVSLDYELVHQLNLTVQAKDHGIPPLDDNASIVINIQDINDNAPIIDSDLTQNLTLLENVLQGTRVVIINATDADSGPNSNLTFSIVGGEINGAFSINSSNGLISTASLLDFEKARYYALNVTVEDHGTPPLKSSVLVHVEVIDVNDMAPVISALTPVYVRENVAVDTVIARVNATDGDSGMNSVLNFSIVSGNLAFAFAINETSGVITTTHAVDHENVSEYRLNISVTDNGSPPLSSSAILQIYVIDVNDHRPIFSQDLYEVSVYENFTLNATVLRVHARDLDSSKAGGIVYSFEKGNPNGTFFLNSSSGEIKLAQELDFEDRKEYLILVKAMDTFLPNNSVDVVGEANDSNSSISLFSHANVSFKVLDVNDNPPRFVEDSYSVVISERLQPGSLISRVKATDHDTGENAMISYTILPPSSARGMFAIHGSTGEIRTNSSLRDANYLTIDLSVIASDGGSPRRSGSVLLSVKIDYNVTFNYNETSPFTYLLRGAFQVGSPTMLSRLHANTKIGLFSQMSGSFQVSVGNVQLSDTFELLKKPALYVKASLVSDWPDYQAIRVATQVFDRSFNVKTAPAKVYFKVVNMATNSEVNISCVPSADTGICVGSLHILREWPNITLSPQLASVQYGLLPSRMVELTQVRLTGQRKPQIDGNFVILAPLYLLNVGDEFSLQVFGYYPKLVQYYALMFALSSGLKIKHMEAAPSWRVQTTFNGVSQFVVFGVRRDFQSEGTGDRTNLYFTINVEITEIANVVTPEHMECVVSQVSDQEGKQIIAAPMKAVFEDRFGRHETGQFVVVPHEVKALFIVPDHSVIFNTALLNGKRIDVAMVVYGVTALGKIVNVTDVACRSLDDTVLKAASDCSSVYVTGNETKSSTEAVIEVSHHNLTVNYSFIVWTPITPVSLSVTLARLKRIRDWYDPDDLCKSRYQQTRVTARADFSNGKQSYAGVDVTQYVKDNLQSSNTSVAEIVGSTVHGKNVGKTTVKVYITELNQNIGQVIVEVSAEDTRVYLLEAIVTTRVISTLPRSLNNSLEYEVITDINERFSIPEDEGSLVISVQYSDGAVNTFKDLSGFFTNTTDNSSVTVQGGHVSAVNNSSGNLLYVVMHSGHCSQQPVISSFVNVAVSFQEPDFVFVNSTSRHITLSGDPAEVIGVPLFAEIKVFLVYNSSGLEQRIDISRKNWTIYSLEIGANVANFSVRERGVVISSSGNGFGQVELSVKITHFKARGHVTLQVIGAQELRLYARPYPVYNSSVDRNVTHLYPIGNSGIYQQSRLNLLLVLSNGTVTDVTKHARARFEITSTQPAELAQNSSIKVLDEYHVVTVWWNSGRAQVSISASFMGAFNQVLNLRVEPTPLSVTSVVFILAPNFTLSGLRDNGTLKLSINLEFSDNSKLLGLFSSENTNFYNLVTFSTQDTTKISVNEKSGLVTLKSNSPHEVRVTVTAVESPSIKDTLAFACNLSPDVGDVDIGDVTGVPLKPMSEGETFTASVRINAGTVVLGSFDVEIVYDNELLEIVHVSEGADMVGFFIANTFSQTGKIRIAGALSLQTQNHHLRHVGVVKFRVTSGGKAHIKGSSLMIAADDLVGSVIGPPVPRAIIAGDIEIETGNSVGRLRRSLESEHAQFSSNSRTKRSVVPCASPPCQSCSDAREPGDTDGNCIFDIRDVKFTLTYMTEKQFNFSRTKGQQIQNSITEQQLQSLDANGDGSVTLSDVSLLLNAHLNVIPLFPKISVVPVEDPKSRCLLTISLSATELGITPSSANQTKIFFDFSHSEQYFSSSFHESVFTKGALYTTEKGPGINGGIIHAEYNSAEKTFVTSLKTSLIYSNIGLSFVQVGFLNDGSIDLSRTLLVNGLYTQPPLYQGILNATLVLGSGRSFSIQRLNGYNPYTFFNNSLASTNCSDMPLLESDLFLDPVDARKVLVTWKLSNVRKGLNFSFILTLQLCDPALLNEPCQVRTVHAIGTRHTVSRLNPYTNYSVKVETTGIPVRETRWVTVRTLESVPEGVHPPVLEPTGFSSLNASWTEPDKPNGVIISYSLHMRNMSAYTVLYQGSSMSYHVTGLSAGQEYFFYIMANTSIGGTQSVIVSASILVERIEPTSGARTTGVSVGFIVGITIAGAAFIATLIILIVWLVRRHSDRRKPSTLDYHSLFKYNSLDGTFRENFPMQLRSTSSNLQETSLRERMYESHFSIDGLENPWRQQDSPAVDSNDSLAMVNHRDFEPSSTRNETWNRGYEETVLKEALKEMNDLDVAVKENIDSEGPVNGFGGQQSSLNEDNLVQITRQSDSQSTFSSENTSRKKSKKSKGDRSKDHVSEGTVEWDYYYGLNASSENEMGPVDTKSRGQIRKARQLAEEMIQQLANGAVNKEYRSLAAERTEGSCLCANDPVNLPKNRYRNILPFDHSRVKLMQVEEGCDYINANFLDGVKQKNAYIATQGPLDSTIADFWQMVWEQNVHVIVMLTRLQEGKKVKCVKYWPDMDEEVTFKDFVITSTYKRKLESRVVRRFILEDSCSGECRELTYFQFTAWPDFGIPSSPADFLELYYEIMQEYKALPVSGTPILVHCSAGVGRSGAFCAINNCLQSFRSTGKIDVAESVRSLRKQRSGMVQTLEQYVFCYKCLVLALLYHIKLRRVKGISLLSQSALSSTGVWTSAERTRSPQDSKNKSLVTQSRLQSPTSGRSEESVTSHGTPPYSYSQRKLPPIMLQDVSRGIGPSREVSQENELSPVVVHSTPKKFVSKEASLLMSKDDIVISREPSHENPRNLGGATGRRKTTGNIRRRPDLGSPPPPPPPPPPLPPSLLPSIVADENKGGNADSFPELPEIDYANFDFPDDNGERDSPPFPPPPEEFFLPVEPDEQPKGHLDSSA